MRAAILRVIHSAGRSFVVGAAVTLALMVLHPAPLRAQASSTSRDSGQSFGRVYRLQIGRGDTNYVRSLRTTRRQLEDRLDSLQREFEGLGLDAPDRVDLVRELRTLLSSLANLTQLEQQARLRVPQPPAGALERARIRALAGAQVFAGRLQTPGASLQPGWIGINAEAPHTWLVRNDSAYIRYYGYPEVVSIEPNSPAERAGISRGDQLLAYDGADLRNHEVNLTRLLQPSRRLRVTVRRDGDEHEFTVLVGTPPRQVVERLQQFSLPDLQDSIPGIVLMRPRAAPRVGASAGTLFDRMDPESAPVAGARLVEINDRAFGHIFGVSNGVLVTEVFSDPARASGLRGGDVILRADGEDLTSVAQLRRIVAGHRGDRSVDLEIVRQKRNRSLTLRW